MRLPRASSALACAIALGAVTASCGGASKPKPPASSEARGWTLGPAMSQRRSYTASALVGSSVYVAGGMVGDTGRWLRLVAALRPARGRVDDALAAAGRRAGGIGGRARADDLRRRRDDAVGRRAAGLRVLGRPGHLAPRSRRCRRRATTAPRSLSAGRSGTSAASASSSRSATSSSTTRRGTAGAPARRCRRRSTRSARSSSAAGSGRSAASTRAGSGSARSGCSTRPRGAGEPARACRPGSSSPARPSRTGGCTRSGSTRSSSTTRARGAGRAGPSPQVPRHALALFAVAGRLWAIGGCTVDLHDSQVVEERPALVATPPFALR